MLNYGPNPVPCRTVTRGNSLEAVAAPRVETKFGWKTEASLTGTELDRLKISLEESMSFWTDAGTLITLSMPRDFTESGAVRPHVPLEIGGEGNPERACRASNQGRAAWSMHAKDR